MILLFTVCQNPLKIVMKDVYCLGGRSKWNGWMKDSIHRDYKPTERKILRALHPIDTCTVTMVHLGFRS